MQKILISAAGVTTALVLASTAFAGSRADTYYTVVCDIQGVPVEFESVDENAYEAKLAALERFPRGECRLAGPFTNP
jgi:hypothetical protein